MRILLTSDTSTNPNLGCQANTAALYENILKYFPEADIDRITLQALLTNKEINMVEHVYKGGQPTNIITSCLSMPNYDIMIVNGEGGIGQYAKDRLSTVSESIFSLVHNAKISGVKTYMVNYTHNIHSKQNNTLAKNAYAVCDCVSVRESISYDRVKLLCDNVRLFPDLVSTHTKPDVDRSNLIMLGGGTCLKITNRRDAFRAYERIIEKLLNYDQYSIIVVGWPSIIKGDNKFFNEFRRNHKYPITYVNLVYYKDYIELCSKAVLNITGRHHGTVMSFLSGCPFLPIASQSCKVRGDNILYQGTDYAMDLTGDDTEVQIDNHIQRIDELRETIIERYRKLEPYLDGHIKQIWHKDTPDLFTEPAIIKRGKI